MSAEQLTTTRSWRKAAPSLRVITKPVARMSTLSFVGVILVMVTIGLVAVMVLTTTVNAQSRELSALQRQSAQLGYQAAALESQYEHVTSTNALALRAAELGMVPNPYPAFIDLKDGSVTGAPTPVKGDEMPYLRGSNAPSEPKTSGDNIPRNDANGQPQRSSNSGLVAAPGAGNSTQGQTSSVAGQPAGGNQ